MPITEAEERGLISKIVELFRRRIIYPPHADMHAPGAPDAIQGSTGGSIEVQDEGTTVGTRSKLNFIGAGVTAADDPGNARININIPGGSTTGYSQIQENGTNLTQRATLDFQAGVIAADDSVNLKTTVNVDYGGAPVNVDLGAASAGTSSQVSRADHKHSAPTGTPSGLGNSNSAGTSNSIPRLDHVHKRDVRVASGGTDVGTRNRLNFSGLTVADDATNDEVDITHDASSAGHHAQQHAIESTADHTTSGGTDGYVLRQTGATSFAWEPLRKQITIIIDGGGQAITTGLKAYLPIRGWSGIIEQWALVADQSGSIVIDVWKDTWVNFPPTSVDSIAGTEKPTLSSAQKAEDTSLTTWTTTVTDGDVLAFNVDSASTVQRVTLVLQVRVT